MNANRTLTARRPCPRPGFTLVELLVVLGIVGILMALTASGVFKYLEAQTQTNTETTIRTVYQVLQQHWAKVVADARKEVPSPLVLALAGNDPIRAQVIWVKFRLMEAFPMNFREIQAFPLYSPTSPYIPVNNQRYMTTYLKQLGTTMGSNPPKPSESAACLLLALQVNRSGVALDPDSLGSTITDTDGDGMKEIVDGWGTPLAFFRFPTGNTELNSLPGTYIPNPSVKFQDPLDPEGTLVAPAWYASSKRVQFENLCHKVNSVGAFPSSLSEAYIVPVIVSAGRDTLLGLQNPSFPTPNPMTSLGTGQDFDNICSYRLRLGARGD